MVIQEKRGQHGELGGWTVGGTGPQGPGLCPEDKPDRQPHASTCSEQGALLTDPGGQDILWGPASTGTRAQVPGAQLALGQDDAAALPSPGLLMDATFHATGPRGNRQDWAGLL